MRRLSAVLMALLVVGMVSLGGEWENWATDGTTYYSSAIVVQNVSDTAAIVAITYQTPCDPLTADYEATVPAGTSQTVTVNDAFPGPWGATAIVTSDVPIVATSNIVWADPSGGTQWAPHAGAVSGPSTTWYLAEGNTYGRFQSYIAVQNTGEQPAQVEVAFMTPGGSHAGPTVIVDPFSQTEINVADTLPDWSSISAIVTSDVPVIAQLSTYWNGGSSTSSTMGAAVPEATWFLAEGSTAHGYSTWITVQNPSPTTANVEVTYIADGGQISGSTLHVPGMTHSTFDASQTLPNQPHFSTMITSDTPIVAVQSKTWEDHRGYAGTMGVPSGSTEWFFPTVRAYSDASTWIAVQNVGDTSAHVSITYATSSGVSDGSALSLDPFARESISLPESIDGQTNFSAVVTSDQPIVAVHGSYWETGHGVHQSYTSGVTQSSMTWFVPITPHAPAQVSQDSGSTSAPMMIDDRDGDGVPDSDDFCPDYPGSASTNGC